MAPWILILAFLVGLVLLYAALSYFSNPGRGGLPARPGRATDPDRQGLTPKNVAPRKPARPAAVAIKPKPAKPAPRPATNAPAQPACLPAMAPPSSEPFSRRTARQAAAGRRRVWITYLDEGKVPVVDKLEIYQATLGGHLLAWFSLKRKRDRFPRHRIVAWQVLDETFEHSDSLARWARREAFFAIPNRLARLLKHSG